MRFWVRGKEWEKGTRGENAGCPWSVYIPVGRQNLRNPILNTVLYSNFEVLFIEGKLLKLDGRCRDILKCVKKRRS